LVSAAGLVVSGVVAALSRVATFAALIGTGYGRLLLLKLALVALVVAVGARNWRRIAPALGDDRGTDRLRRGARTEIGLGAVVLAVTAVLVATPPPAFAPTVQGDEPPTRFDVDEVRRVMDSV